MKKFLNALFAVTLLAACDDSTGSHPRKASLGDVRLRRFVSCAEMGRVLAPLGYAPRASEPAATADIGGASPGAPRGETNLQVAGVDEMDTSKADGADLYTVSREDSKLRVVRRRPTAQAALIQTLSLDAPPAGLFVTAEQVVALTQKSPYYNFRSPLLTDAQPVPPEQWSAEIGLVFFARAGDGTLEKKGERTVSGTLNAGRMIGSRIHLAISKELRRGEEPVEALLPKTAYGGARQPLFRCGDVFHEPAAGGSAGAPVVDSLQCVVSLDARKPDRVPAGECIAANSTSISYASTENFFLASRGWMNTPIHRFALETESRATRYLGSALADGTLLNSFSMDEFAGHLRVASHSESWDDDAPATAVPMTASAPVSARSRTSAWTNQVEIFRLGEGDLRRVGRAEGLGRGETIYAVRFMGDKGFVVTFKKVDPLYALDLSNPSIPRVRGELKIPGYSSYLHPMQEGHLLAVGKDAEAASQSADFAWYQGMAMSIFDVRDMDSPKLVQKIGIGSRGTESEALRDHKAFRYIPQEKLVIFPIDLYEGGGGGFDFGTRTFSGFHVYRATVEDGFSLVGTSPFAPSNAYWYYGAGARSFYRDGVFDLLGGGKVVSRNASAPDADVATVLLK